MARSTATALLGVGLCLIGASFDSGSLYLPGIAMVIAVVLSTAWVRIAAGGARVTRLPGPATVVEDEPFRVQVEARLDGIPAPGGELADPLLPHTRPLAGRRRVSLDALASLPRRGRVRLAPSVLTVRDPLRLSARRILGPDGHELLVLPRIDPVTAAGAGGDAGSGGTAGAGAGAADGSSRRAGSLDGLDVDGLRSYREGTPASRIHWATLARRGEMMERRFVSESASVPLVVLDAAAPTGPAALDAAVRAAASLCFALASADGVALLLPGARSPVEIDRDLGTWPAVHRRLALVEEGARPSIGWLGLRSGALLWVTGGETAALPQELELLPMRPRYLVAPTLPDDAVIAFEVAGCRAALLDPAHRSAAA